DLRIAHDVLHRLGRDIAAAEHVERHAILDRPVETDRRTERDRARIAGLRSRSGAARDPALHGGRARELLRRRVVELDPADDLAAVGIADRIHREERAVDAEAVAEDIPALRLAFLIDRAQMPVPE